MLQITARPYYCDIIRKHKLTEKITELSTSISVDNGIRKAAELVLHNIQRTRKSILNNQASILPQSIVGPSLEEALSLLNSNSL